VRFVTVIQVTADLLMLLGLGLIAVYVVIAALDYMYERWQTERDLRMTRDEVKRESKDQEMGAEMKAVLKRRQRDMATRRMMTAVPDADVVITNPTHFAVALRYARALPAPQVVAKGADLVAKRIIAAAEENGVAVVREPPLARSLHDAVEVGGYIPGETFAAVAEILAHVYRVGHRGPAVA